MHDFLRQAESMFDYTRRLRRDFHAHPELGFQEVRTAGIVAQELRQLGLEVTTGVAQTGVIAMLEGDHPGPVVLLRFDMDALPIQEETGAEYSSQNPGVMHACGHDGHTAIGLTVARLLHAHRSEIAGAVKFVFQPAEEGLGGAQGMLAEGVLEHPRPDLCLGLHLWNEFPLGWLGITPGPVMAASEIFTIILHGRGGHGALPHQTIDPVVAAAQIITALQSIVARNVSPLHTAVLSVTQIHAGEAFNVIPARAELKGTIRTYQPEVRSAVMGRFESMVRNIAEGLGCKAEMQMQSLTPAVINHPQAVQLVQTAAARLLPTDNLDADYRTMGSEDMAYLMQDIPGCYFFVGSADPGRGLDSAHHHPRFDFNEDVLPRAAALLAQATVDYLKSP